MRSRVPVVCLLLSSTKLKPTLLVAPCMLLNESFSSFGVAQTYQSTAHRTNERTQHLLCLSPMISKQRTGHQNAISVCVIRLDIARHPRKKGSILAQGRNVTRIVDKMLRNAFNLGYIQLTLPKACIVHAVRHPLDVALSCFSQPFEGRGLPWAAQLDGDRWITLFLCGITVPMCSEALSLLE